MSFRVGGSNAHATRPDDLGGINAGGAGDGLNNSHAVANRDLRWAFLLFPDGSRVAPHGPVAGEPATNSAPRVGAGRRLGEHVLTVPRHNGESSIDGCGGVGHSGSDVCRARAVGVGVEHIYRRMVALT